MRSFCWTKFCLYIGTGMHSKYLLEKNIKNNNNKNIYTTKFETYRKRYETDFRLLGKQLVTGE